MPFVLLHFHKEKGPAGTLQDVYKRQVFLIGGFLGSFGIGEGLPLAVDVNGNRVFIQHFLKG